MGGYLHWGVRVVVRMQTNAGGWKPLLQALSLLGTEEFLLPLGITLYWCIDAALGMRLGLLLTAGVSLGGPLKMFFHMPHPDWYDPRALPLAAEIS